MPLSIQVKFLQVYRKRHLCGWVAKAFKRLI
ncbi:MAG: hypothetical protein QMD16_17435 [Desulfitobacteriaceae bacterium]|nr:hypothetical protein [Desulfitobacteriaceae bacterium]